MLNAGKKQTIGIGGEDEREKKLLSSCYHKTFTSFFRRIFTSQDFPIAKNIFNEKFDNSSYNFKRHASDAITRA